MAMEQKTFRKYTKT